MDSTMWAVVITAVVTLFAAFFGQWVIHRAALKVADREGQRQERQELVELFVELDRTCGHWIRAAKGLGDAISRGYQPALDYVDRGNEGLPGRWMPELQSVLMRVKLTVRDGSIAALASDLHLMISGKDPRVSDLGNAVMALRRRVAPDAKDVKGFLTLANDVYECSTKLASRAAERLARTWPEHGASKYALRSRLKRVGGRLARTTTTTTTTT